MGEFYTLKEQYREGYWLDRRYDIIYQISNPDSPDINDPSDESIKLTPVHSSANELCISTDEWQKRRLEFTKVGGWVVDNPETYIDNAMKMLARNDNNELGEWSSKKASVLRCCMKMVEINKK
jgi:hypothetical protein